MRENNLSEEIYEKIKGSQKILMSLHDGPDGDSLGSSTAMKYFLENVLKKDVTLISKDSLGDVFELFDFYGEVNWGKGFSDYNLDDFDLILFLDFGTPSYLSNKKMDLPEGKVMNIDHHETNTLFGDYNYVKKDRPSACSVLIDLFKEWGVDFDKELSTRLLLGVYTDSGGFSFETNSLKDAGFLIDVEADYMKIVDAINFNIPLKLKKFLALATNNFKIVDFEEVKVGVCLLRKKEILELGLSLSEARMAPNDLQVIGGVDFLFVLTEFEEGIKGSFRSRKNVNTPLFAKELGGGGHKFASAFRIMDIELEEAEEKVFDAIRRAGIHRVE
jgi:phosphoesterase RecJ-like protein|tara:strand:+ start:9212 stop:10204 length:993 start_codon:yes stop_codon:yes gene_type:complete